VQWSAARQFDDAGKHVGGIAVLKHCSGLSLERKQRQSSDHFSKRMSVFQTGSSIDCVNWFPGRFVDDAGSMGEQMKNRDRLVSGHQFRVLRATAGDDLGIAKLRKIFLYRIKQTQFPFLEEG